MGRRGKQGQYQRLLTSSPTQIDGGLGARGKAVEGCRVEALERQCSNSRRVLEPVWSFSISIRPTCHWPLTFLMSLG